MSAKFSPTYDHVWGGGQNQYDIFASIGFDLPHSGISDYPLGPCCMLDILDFPNTLYVRPLRRMLRFSARLPYVAHVGNVSLTHPCFVDILD